MDKHPISGADERTPSHPQYFSWINNTNEGSTEAQTLVNLDYFRYLHDKYGMKLEIYAWDAGNLDGARETYEKLGKSEKLAKQFPNGYAEIAKAAGKIGARLGVWCGPDGFGNDEESARERIEQMVSLCRDYHFSLFKIDGVCGTLSPEHQKYFVEQMKGCRTYSPDLVLLNHRLELGIGMPYATTFLWNGEETYVDVFQSNRRTAPHHREFIFRRGNVPGLQRLTEDHGVCISSCPDYFDDDLTIQAFGRCLILAPEIYGNPWFLRDDEQALLAHIYNLHYKYRDILVDGMLLPDSYPANAVARGSASHRFLTLGNDSWTPLRVGIKLDTEIGLAPCGADRRFRAALRLPYDELIGEFSYGDTAEIEIPAFRAALVEIVAADEAEPLEGFGAAAKAMRAPKKLSTTRDIPLPDDADVLLETAQFGQNQDSLESRSILRSGPTAIPEVKAARDAFFAQKTYAARGCESRFAFDGDDATFFDGISKTFFGSLRMDGGCLRADFGGVFDADSVVFEYFDIDEPSHEIEKQVLRPVCDVSADLRSWNAAYLDEVKTLYREEIDSLVDSVHNFVKRSGKRRTASYSITAPLRYLRMPLPLDRIHRISLYKNGVELKLDSPHINNLLPPPRQAVYAKRATVTVSPEDFREGCYLSVALEGEHGREGAYAVARIGAELLPFPDRAPGYLANVWECKVHSTINVSANYTYFLPVTRDMCGREIEITVAGVDADKSSYQADVWLCDKKV